ncbi:MAG: hypothetical protein BWY91_02975 [bacterium ADurb.BinA028]|nr:MAG: hypothetical protein BWY91_02975 [bacterium ADurb.BinA028]
MHHRRELRTARLDRGSGRSASDDKGHLAEDPGLGPLGEFSQPAAADLLVGLGELAAYGTGTVGPPDRSHRGERRGGAVRCLEEDHGPRLVRERSQRPGPLSRFARQETLEAEAVDREPADRERHEHGARAGDTGDPDASLDRSGNKSVARVRDGRHTGVCDHENPCAREQLLDQLGSPGGLVVLVIAQDPPRDGHAEVGGEAPQPAGVLGRDDVGASQLLCQPGCGVAGVADRRGREDEDTAHVRSLR